MPDAWLPAIQETLASGQRTETEYTAGDHVFSCCSAGGASNYVNIYGRDITARRAAEEALRRSENRLDSILGSLDDVVWSITMPDQKRVYLSPAAEALYGYPVDELIHSPDLWHQVVHPEDRPRVMAYWEDIVPQGAAEIEYRIVRPDGEVRWVYDRGHVIVDDAGNPVRVDTVVADFTARKLAEDRLRYRIAFEELVTDLSTRFVKLAAGEVEEAINQALAAIGTFAAVDRAYVFLFAADGANMNNTHEWCAAGIEPQIENLQGIPSEILPWWMGKLRRSENVHIPSVADLPPEAAAEREILEPKAFVR